MIKKNAWLGEGVAVMPGVTIGENSVIGANAVVTKDIPDNSIAVGIPAKVIKQF
ncbi:DapH/DapD/GlmU-related protein [Bacteroides fragilis]